MKILYDAKIIGKGTKIHGLHIFDCSTIIGCSQDLNCKTKLCDWRIRHVSETILVRINNVCYDMINQRN